MQESIIFSSPQNVDNAFQTCQALTWLQVINKNLFTVFINLSKSFSSVIHESS